MGSIPAAGEENFWYPNMLSLVSFAGMTLNKCAVLRIGTLTGGSLCRESHPLCRLKNRTVVYMITYTLIQQNRCVQCTPAHNPRERCSSMYCIERHHHLSTYMKLMPLSYHLHPDMFMFLPNSNSYHVVSTTSLVKLVFILLIFQGVGSAGVGSLANVTTNN